MTQGRKLRLRIKVVEGKNLGHPNGDFVNFFLSVRLAGKWNAIFGKRSKTIPVRTNKDAIIDQEIVLDAKSRDSIVITAKSRRIGKLNWSIAKTVLPLHQFEDVGTVDTWIPMDGKGSFRCGRRADIHCLITFQNIE
eukprot:TRINITY_DN9670_c0_g1_i1.p1 TRINITY_DN9670_c0_g1~~TRINITY_DN9670_c0_g1_i1.p1  ORF type:complete len:144 (-),score=23.06 TRINITY_DN9670_c0_g1_i1:148-558(-)